MTAESALFVAVHERYPECPRCHTASGYLTTWHDGDFITWLAGFIGVSGCRTRGDHFDAWCRKCYFVVATAKP